MRSVVLIVCLGLIAMYSMSDAQSNDPYYMLALQKCSSSSPWTLHGLWPQWADCCKGPAFNYTALQPMLDEMNKYWPSCPQYGTTNEDLWSHEWEKHGTCTGLNQNAYFQQAINLLLANSKNCTSTTATSCDLCFTTQFDTTGSSNCASSGSYPDC